MKLKKIIKYIIIFVLGIIVARFIFFRNGVKAIPVKKVEITPRVVKRTVSASGEVKSKDEATLSFGSAGRIREVKVEKGTLAKEGDVLASIDNSSDYQDIQYYKDARDVAARDVDLFVENYASNLQAAGGADEYEIQLRRLRELLSKAEAAYQSSLSGITSTYVYAPFQGTVIDVMQEEGENVAATTGIVKLADLGNLIFEITLDQEDYGFVKPGQAVEIELDSYENHTFLGKITNLPYYANGGDSPNFTVEIDIDTDNDKRAMLGMTGDAHIVVATTETEVPSLIYDEVLYDEENNSYVWVSEEGILAKEYIEIGLEGDIYTEVKTAIEKDIVIAIGKDEEIKEGYQAKFTKK